MSRREWEEGTIKLAVKEFARFRQELVAAHNNACEHDFKLLTQLHAAVALAAKGKRNFDYRAAIDEECAKSVAARWASTRLSYPFKLLDSWNVASLLLSENGKLHTPKKKDLPTATVGAKTNSFPLPSSPTKGNEGSIHLNAETKEVSWCVSEGNHACDDASAGLYGNFFYRFMGTVVWTRDTGGVITGNDEYNEDTRDVGGSANYIKLAWGPRGTAEREAQWGLKLPRRSSKSRTR